MEAIQTEVDKKGTDKEERHTEVERKKKEKKTPHVKKQLGSFSV